MRSGKCRERDFVARQARREAVVSGGPRFGKMVLVTFAETKVIRRTGAEPRIKFLCKYAQ